MTYAELQADPQRPQCLGTGSYTTKLQLILTYCLRYNRSDLIGGFDDLIGASLVTELSEVDKLKVDNFLEKHKIIEKPQKTLLHKQFLRLLE